MSPGSRCDLHKADAPSGQQPVQRRMRCRECCQLLKPPSVGDLEFANHNSVMRIMQAKMDTSSPTTPFATPCYTMTSIRYLMQAVLATSSFHGITAFPAAACYKRYLPLSVWLGQGGHLGCSVRSSLDLTKSSAGFVVAFITWRCDWHVQEVRGKGDHPDPKLSRDDRDRDSVGHISCHVQTIGTEAE